MGTEREFICNRCDGGYYSSDPATDRNGLCGECAELFAYSKLARQTLRSHEGRGDSVSAQLEMGYPSHGEAGEVTYLVREYGGSIPKQTLCAAHNALYVWDALSADLSGEDLAAHYATQDVAGNCDTCNEFARGDVERRPRGDAHCATCRCNKGGRS